MHGKRGFPAPAFLSNDGNRFHTSPLKSHIAG
jgi:hypothetical protein